ncbi:MAG TPA: DEAD/DEAH box helicase [Chloroflexia bacterium]
MPWNRLSTLLNNIFDDMNRSNSVANPDLIWQTYQVQLESLLAELPNAFVELAPGQYHARAVELGRVLSNVRQRFNAAQDGRGLVNRVRAEAVLRQRPPSNVDANTLVDEERAIGDIAGFQSYSRFQIEGWKKTLGAIRERSSLVVVAPTGSGKTEAFLLPAIYEIARCLRDNRPAPRFIFLYPRVTLLKDQLSRVFRYVYQAERQMLSNSYSARAREGIILGFQFGGIASQRDRTLANPRVFDNHRFRTLRNEVCPVCGLGSLFYVTRASPQVPILRCNRQSCAAEFKVSIAKNDHATLKPNILITTAESLDRLYLTPTRDFEDYLRSLSGVLFDEVHLYHSLYGAHIHNIVRRVQELRPEQPLSKIAASATISSPERFAGRFLNGDENTPVTVHSASDYDMEASGLEVLYFLQAPDVQDRAQSAPLLIQSVMGLGHSSQIDRPNQQSDRAIVFTESLDLASRLQAQTRDAENNGQLWRFRTILNEIEFQGRRCPNTTAGQCASHYLLGECWRGLLGGVRCTQPIIGLRERPLNISYVSSLSQEGYWDGDIVVATPSLEVGVDDDRIKTTIHYRPPRTVFSFIQRRGRAGRAANEIAYTLMILGNAASDQFYFFRRHRLIHGNYELPLNPQNPVVRAMHDKLTQERTALSRYIQWSNGRVKGAIISWICSKLGGCPIIQTHFRDALVALESGPVQSRRRVFLDWITQERIRFEAYLNLRWTLRDIQNQSPDDLQPQVQEVQELIARYLSGEATIENTIRQHLSQIRDQLGNLIMGEADADNIEALRRLRDRVEDAWLTLRQQAQIGINFDLADGLYNFFRTLERFKRDDFGTDFWRLSSTPDAIKIVSQAFFYLGLATQHDTRQCQSCIRYYIPEAYFSEVKPIVVEVRSSTNLLQAPQLEEEDTTQLAGMLIPYKTVYHYHLHPFLSLIETENSSDWIDRSQGTVTVGVRLLGEGVHRDNSFRPEKVYVRPLRGDQQGDQVVKMCPQCFALYDETRRRQCHDQDLQTVRLYAQPIIERDYLYQPEEVRTLSRTLRFVQALTGDITVHGSLVRSMPVRFVTTRNRYIVTPGTQPLTFRAQYVDSQGRTEPVRYGLATKGIAWNLNEVQQQLLDDRTLRDRVEGVMITNETKVFGSQIILHTAAHMLQKAVASISGVNEDVLQYAFNEARGEVVVWERYEGGAGISEIFADALRANPIEIYKELLASVLCPIHLAEQTDWTTSEELKSQLATRWYLHDDDDLLNITVQEAIAERIAAPTSGADPGVLVPLQCRERDGCPACLHTTNCTELLDEPLRVSHIVAETLMSRFIQQMDTEHLGRTWIDGGQIVDPQATILRADLEEGVYDVLLL